jgi:hypothetical protein
MTARAAWILSAAVALMAESRALARERIAVLIFPVQGHDTALADNLGEVAIARLAEMSAYEIVGTRELRRRLALAGAGDLPLDCMNQPACLARVGVMVGVRRLISGQVRSEGPRFLVALAISDIETGKVERNFFRAVDGDLESLIHAIQDGMDNLFQRRPAPGQLRVDSTPPGATVVVDERDRGITPLWVSPLEPGAHRLRIEMNGRFPLKRELVLAPGQDLLVTVGKDELPPRRAWAPYLAYGTAAIAVLSFAAAGLFGTLARVDASGRTRGDAQMDLELRKTYATITNVLLVTGGAMAGVSAFTFIRLRHDIAGE